MIQTTGSMYFTDLQKSLTKTEDISKHGEFYEAVYDLVYKGKVHLSDKGDAQTVSLVNRILH